MLINLYAITYRMFDGTFLKEQQIIHAAGEFPEHALQAVRKHFGAWDMRVERVELLGKLAVLKGEVLCSKTVQAPVWNNDNDGVD